MAAPGWYPDTTMAGTQRYWDGERWTEHVAPLTQPAQRSVVTPPRRRADGSLKGPSLASSLGVIGLGLLLGIASLIVIVPAFVDSLSGPRWQVPGTYRTDLDTGTWVIFERVGFGGPGYIGAGDVVVDGPGMALPVRDDGNQTITINERQYRSAVRFDIETAGTYDVTVRGEPFGGEVLLSRPIWDFFNRWPWFVAGAAGGLLVVIGAVMWIVGGVNRGRAKRMIRAANRS